LELDVFHSETSAVRKIDAEEQIEQSRSVDNAFVQNDDAFSAGSDRYESAGPSPGPRRFMEEESLASGGIGSDRYHAAVEYGFFRCPQQDADSTFEWNLPFDMTSSEKFRHEFIDKPSKVAVAFFASSIQRHEVLYLRVALKKKDRKVKPWVIRAHYT
jgi:hypothetical protein